MKQKHPEALLLVHPESRPEVVELADYVGSTTGIMNFAKESSAKEFIIGTENSIVQHLQMECPEKRFYELSKDCVCRNMKLTTLADVYNIQGVCVKRGVPVTELRSALPPGIYIVNGKKMVVK